MPSLDDFYQDYKHVFDKRFTFVSASYGNDLYLPNQHKPRTHPGHCLISYSNLTQFSPDLLEFHWEIHDWSVIRKMTERVLAV